MTFEDSADAEIAVADGSEDLKQGRGFFASERRMRDQAQISQTVERRRRETTITIVLGGVSPSRRRNVIVGDLANRFRQH